MNYPTRRCSFHPKSLLRFSVVLAGLALCLAAANQAGATGGPENVLLVINPRSPDSLCIANHYAKLRHIPPSNLLFLDWDPKEEMPRSPPFARRSSSPCFESRNCRFPAGRSTMWSTPAVSPGAFASTRISRTVKAALEKQEQGKDEKSTTKSKIWTTFTPVASINGLTYLWELVMTSKFYIHPESNWYARTGVPEQKDEPTLAFSSTTSFGPHGETGSAHGRHYMLSMMLGVTSGRGNTRAEVLSYLNRSAAADGTHPRGNDLLRAERRHSLQGSPGRVSRRGRKAECPGRCGRDPRGHRPGREKRRSRGHVGRGNFDWKASRSTILPGAICEHFTSFGGDMHAAADQTPLSELLRYGATASSGTVTEPYAMPYKFPSPMMQVHYARGCTVAESFYQSVPCPYQLLIVGDPLCRPWANIPEITVTGVTADETVHDEIKVKPKATFAGGLEAEHFEMILDGQNVRRVPAGRRARSRYEQDCRRRPRAPRRGRIQGIPALPR